MEKVMRRVQILKDMDNLLRETIQNENIFVNDWLANGVPDAAEDDVLVFIAMNDSNYYECLESFVRCCIADNKEEDDEYE